MSERLLETLGAGPEEALSGTRTLDLTGEGAWIVVEGSVEVYFRERGSADDPEQVSIRSGRTFLAEVGRGGLVFGFGDAPDADGLDVFAIGVPARVRRLAAGEVTTLVALHGDALGEGIASWLATVSSSLVGPGPKHEHAFPPGERVLLPPGDPTRMAGSGLAWLRPVEGRCRLLGRTEAEFDADDDRVIPLCAPLWIEAVDSEARVDALAMPREARDINGAVHRVSGAFLRAVAEDASAAALDDAMRLRTRVVRERSALEATFEELGAVVKGRADEGATSSATGDPLLEACQAVGRRVGLTLQRPQETSPGARLREPVHAITSASRVRSRKVVLRGEWWQKENGPLLAFVEDDGRPVALLEKGYRRYEMFDPTHGETIPVDEDVADSLSPVAHMFMPSLGFGRVTPLKLVRLGLRGIHGDLAFVVVLGIVAGLLGLLPPILTQVILDDIVPQADRPLLPVVAVMLTVFAVVAAAFSLVQAMLLLRVEAKMEMNMEAALMDRLLRLPLSFYRKFLAGDLADRASGISQIRGAITGGTLSAMLSGVFSVSSLGLLLYYDAGLAVLGVVLTAISLAVIVASTLISVGFERKVAAQRGRISGVLPQMLGAISKVRVAAAEKRAFAVWARDFAKQRSFDYRAGAIENDFQLFQSAFPVMTTMAFFAVVYVAAAGGEPTITSGSFVAAQSAFAQFMGGMLGVGTTLLSIVQIVPKWERLEPILSAEIEGTDEATDPGELSGDFEVRHVTFRYGEDGPLVLDEVSLRAHAGEMVALVGTSGSGKSTLLRLLLGLERPLTGAVTYDGQDLAGLDLEAVRQQIGVVLQAGRVQTGDLASNIIGHWNLTMDDAWRAARLAGLAEDIEAMPMGMHTVVSEGGGTFSGGQLQRLMIARAIVHGPKILLLDEATSALDNRTQRIVTESFERMDVTRLVIAHRLSTIRRADRIYVLEAGRVVEEGSFETLLERDGAFARLARRQLA